MINILKTALGLKSKFVISIVQAMVTIPGKPILVSKQLNKNDLKIKSKEIFNLKSERKSNLLKDINIITVFISDRKSNLIKEFNNVIECKAKESILTSKKIIFLIFLLCFIGQLILFASILTLYGILFIIVR